MKIISKTSLAALAGVSVALLAGSASAQTAGIATAQPDAAILSAKAFATANQTISTQFKTQLDQAQAQQTTLRDQIRTLLDTNKDGQVSQAELTAGQAQGSALGNQVRAAEAKAQPAIDALNAPALKAQAYALEQIGQKYDPALQAVVKAKNINLVLSPNAVQYAPAATDITRDVIAEIDRSTPTVTTTAPANWQPSQDTVQLLQQYRQLVYVNEMRRQQAGPAGAAPAAAGTTPAPASRTKPTGR